MKVFIDSDEMSVEFEKTIEKLVKTTVKLSKCGLSKVRVDISFVDKKEIKKLNKDFRNIDKETDVLSFPVLNLTPMQKVDAKDFMEDFDPETKSIMLGDIIICNEVASKNAEEYGHSFEREVCYLVVHGCLHLLGYDHMEEEDKKLMRAMEETVLSKYKITRNEND